MREEAEKLVQEIRDAGGDAIAVTADCKLTFFSCSYFVHYHCVAVLTNIARVLLLPA
jgi:hypothetical protein